MRENEKILPKIFFSIFFYFFFMWKNVGKCEKSWKIFERYFWKKPKKFLLHAKMKMFGEKKFSQFFFYFFYVEKRQKMWEKVEKILNLKKFLLRAKMKIFTKSFFWDYPVISETVIEENSYIEKVWSKKLFHKFV